MKKMRHSFWIPLRDLTKFIQVCGSRGIATKNAALRGDLPKHIHGFWCYDEEAYTIFELLR
jgi:hypothetical protein